MPPRISFRSADNTGEATGNIVTVYTDVPARIRIRWTTIPPRIHKIPVLRRGMWLNDDVRFCFDVYEDQDQDEPGDTLKHTFTYAPCIQGRHFWYYLWGTVDGVISPSTSPIIEYQSTIGCPDQLVTTIIAENSNRTLRQTWGTWDNCHDRASGAIQPWYGFPLYRLVAEARLTASYFISRSYLRFDTSVIPPSSFIVSATITFRVQIVTKTAQVTWRHIIATQGVQHNPIVTTDYGDQLPYTTNGGQVHLDACIPGFGAVLHLNAQGLAWVIPDGTSRFCLRQELDVLDIPPTLGANELAYTSAQAGEDLRPRLIVWYRPP